MKAYVITVKDNEVSEKAAAACIDSHSKVNNDFPIEIYYGITPDKVDFEFRFLHFRWMYPWDKERVDIRSGLKLTPYTTKDPKKRIACFLSHYNLWLNCVQMKRPILVLEHDAIFTRQFNYQYTLDSKYGIIGINNPIGATRRASVFDNQVQMTRSIKPDADEVVPVPTVDNFDVPQGLAGNSAYVIKPDGAQRLLDVVTEHGAWPNDAIMCKQLLPNVLGVTKKYYTRVQGTKSTTTL